MSNWSNEYWSGRIKRASIARDHTRYVEQLYFNDIMDSVNSSIIYTSESFKSVTLRNLSGMEYSVVSIDTVSAIYDAKYNYPNDKIACLNFASYKHPGGKFLEGSSAQEESLCHESNLFNVLERFTSNYYSYHKNTLNRSLYTNEAIYSPRIRFERDIGYVKCDVITCAAPNKSAAQKYHKVSDMENYNTLVSRCKFVLDIAEDNDVDVLILGAFGCGVFGQDPYEVATIFKGLLLNNPYNFKKVIFAIPDKGHSMYNYRAFVDTFK